MKNLKVINLTTATAAANLTATLAATLALALSACSSPKPAPPVPTSYAPLGVYYWGGSLPHSPVIPAALSLAKSTGTHVIRIYMGADADIKYSGGTCIPGFSLVSLAQRQDFNAILTDPQFSTVIITAYDGVTWPCNGNNLSNASFWAAATSVQGEYTALATYLSTIPKTFIISNWEGDNQAYCGSMSTRSQCDATAPASLAWLSSWFSARHAGIHALVNANSVPQSNVFSAIEFNSVNLLHNAGLPSVLRDVRAPADYLSYSSYESLSSPAQLAADVATIKSIRNTPLFIGELGTTSPAQLHTLLPAATALPVAYVIGWGLLDNPPGFGLFDSTGALTPSGVVFEGLVK